MRRQKVAECLYGDYRRAPYVSPKRTGHRGGREERDDCVHQSASSNVVTTRAWPGTIALLMPLSAEGMSEWQRDAAHGVLTPPCSRLTEHWIITIITKLRLLPRVSIKNQACRRQLAVLAARTSSGQRGAAGRAVHDRSPAGRHSSSGGNQAVVPPRRDCCAHCRRQQHAVVAESPGY